MLPFHPSYWCCLSAPLEVSQPQQVALESWQGGDSLPWGRNWKK